MEENYLSIKNWAEDDRPREKLLNKGASVLSDAELLAIMIGSGSRNESAVQLCRKILKASHDNLNELARLSIDELCKFKGIGEAKAITISAALELGNRRKTNEVRERARITQSRDLFELFEPILLDLKHEEFWVALLNGANKVLDVKRLTQGGTRQTVVDIPMILKMSLEKSAPAIAVAHNHPSGQDNPSREDDAITQRIKKGCEAIDIRLLDHIIIAGGKYYSFADEGKI
ncbi:MAG TPA: DNA repair protein RadC [Paludibacteraceae bacterium]|jgi:DNA repair protein RadC|nr:DNA repair protein RadC [Paludibacteraceae bacterium]HPS10028.1 DNA repair protein RadC [Paludibacteraceae bacterium]